jgi:ABC-type glycerol-3-phosphate transport system substrate-binding protein
MQRPAIGRRHFLAYCGVAAGGLLAAACGGQGGQGGATPAPAATAAGGAAQKAGASAGKPITFLCRNDIVTAYGAEAIITEWNKSHESQVSLEKPAGDVLTKAAAAVAANDVVWDGFSVIVAPWDIATWVKRQIIAPLDDLISASTEPDASKVLPGMIGTIRDAVKYEGKTYMIPGNVGSVALQWFWDPLKAVDVTKQPENWWEGLRMAA